MTRIVLKRFRAFARSLIARTAFVHNRMLAQERVYPVIGAVTLQKSDPQGAGAASSWIAS